jgi:tRNA 2-thiouridine synthesizing protein A
MTKSLDVVEDARGLLCPLPVIRIGERMRAVSPGTTVRLLADDPAAEEDVRLWAKSHGHAVLAVEREGGFLAIRVRRGG